MEIEFLDLTKNVGTWSVEVKVKIEGRTKYFDTRIVLHGTSLKVTQAGIAHNKNRDYKFLTSSDNQYRYLTKSEITAKFREDIKKLVPKEVLIHALNKVRSEIIIESDWILA